MKITNETKILIGVLLLTLVIILVSGLMAGSKKQNSVTKEAVKVDRLVRSDSPVIGYKDAKVTVVEFSNFECSACSAIQPVLKQLQNVMKNESVRFVFRNYPFTSQEEAFLAAEASLAANAQGRFIEYHDMLFENQNDLSRDKLIEYAKKVGLDTERFIKDLDDSKYADTVRRDVEDARALSLRGTPSFFINGVPYDGKFNIDDFTTTINLLLKK